MCDYVSHQSALFKTTLFIPLNKHCKCSDRFCLHKYHLIYHLTVCFLAINDGHSHKDVTDVWRNTGEKKIHVRPQLETAGNPKLSARLIPAGLIIGHLHIRLHRQWEERRLNDAVRSACVAVTVLRGHLPCIANTLIRPRKGFNELL